MRIAAIPTKARKCSALRSYRRWSRRQPDSQDTVLSTTQRCRPSRCEGSMPLRAMPWRIPRACGATGAGGCSRSPCRRVVSPAVDAGGHGGSGWLGCRARVAPSPGCRACWHRRCPETVAARSGPWSGESSIPTCRGQSDSVRSRAPFCRPHADRVDRAARPVQLTTGTELVEDDAVQPSPDPGPAPLRKASIDRGPGRTEHRG